MDSGLFRKKAMEQISSPKRLDTLIKINSTFSWVFLAAIAVFIFGAVIWSIFGLIPTKVKGLGIIITTNSIVKLQAPVSGEIIVLNIKAGDEVKAGQVIARIKQTKMEEKIKILSDKIDVLKQNFIVFNYLNQSELTQQMDFLVQQERSLNNSISELEYQEKWYTEFVSRLKDLNKKGSVSDLKYYDTLKDLSGVRWELNNKKDQLLDISYRKITGVSNLRKEYIEREKEILEQEALLKEMRFELEQSSVFRSPADGKVLEILSGIHQMVHEGSDFAVLLKTDRSEELEALIYFPSIEGKKIKRFMSAHVLPLNVTPSKYGYIKAIVESVDEYPSSSAGMLNTLQNPDLVKMLTKDDAPIRVKLDLIHSEETVSGLEWTSDQGAPFAIEAGTLCSGSIIIKEEPPITFVLPFLKRAIVGYED